jgi:hypothetical protein
MLIDNSLLDPPVAEGPNPFETLRCWIIVVLCSLVFGSVLGLTAIVFTIKTNNKIHEAPQPPTLFSVPYRFRLPDAFSLPPTDQMDVGTCWAFSTIYLLESQYRAQGVREGLLSELDYTRFSVEAYLNFIHEQCRANPSIKACHYGGMLKDDPADHQIESLWYWLRAWPELGTSIVPDSVCAYQNNRTHYFECPGLAGAISKNPLNWTIKSLTNAYGVKATKELLLRSKRALGISVPLPNLIYYVPCQGSAFEASSDCVAQRYPCPEPHAGDFCHKAVLDARDQTGVFLANAETKYMGELGGHGMNIVGYNDDWVYKNRFQSRQATAQLKGGFILHNSWRAGGHSVDYLYGDQSEENEAVICPNHVAPVNWIPATYKCVADEAAAGRIVNGSVNCSSDLQRIRGRGRTKGADLLYCNHPACDANLMYILERVGWDVNHTFTASGLADVGLITYNNQTGQVGNASVRSLPFWALSQYFKPVSETFVPNDRNDCGYWMLPYETLDHMIRINWDLLDNFRVVDLEIQFEEQSYPTHPDSWNYNTAFLNQSTLPRNKTAFVGPLPFDLIY